MPIQAMPPYLLEVFAKICAEVGPPPVVNCQLLCQTIHRELGQNSTLPLTFSSPPPRSFSLQISKAHSKTAKSCKGTGKGPQGEGTWSSDPGPPPLVKGSMNKQKVVRSKLTHNDRNAQKNF